MSRLSRLLLIVLSAQTLAVSPAAATSLTVKCQSNDPAVPGDMTVVYEGESKGTVTITAPFGTMSLPATIETQTVDNEGGKRQVTQVHAFGRANVLMPDLGTLQSCITGKAGANAAEPDVLALALQSCLPSTPSKTPVEITATVNFAQDPAILDPPGVFLEMRRTYAETAAGAGGKLTIEAVPPPACALSASHARIYRWPAEERLAPGTSLSLRPPFYAAHLDHARCGSQPTWQAPFGSLPCGQNSVQLP